MASSPLPKFGLANSKGPWEAQTHGTCAIYFPGGFWSFSSKEDINFKGIVRWFWKTKSIKIMTLNSECCRGTYRCPNTWRMIGSMTMEQQYFGWGRVMPLWQSLIILGYQRRRKREGINNLTNKQSLVSGKHQHSSPEVPERIPQGIWVLKWLTLNRIESDAKIVLLRICPKKKSHSWCSILFAPKHLNVFPRNQTNLDHITWASGICIPKVVLENTSQTKPISCSISIDTDLFVGFNRNRGPSKHLQGTGGGGDKCPTNDQWSRGPQGLYHSEKIKHNESRLSNVCIY